jgi:chemotaxis protein methyltransferase CheR
MSAVQTIAEDLTDRQFNTISNLVKDLCGINLHDGKKELVRARLTKRLHETRLGSFSQYIEHIGTASGQAEVLSMLDALSTNLTFFFRESAHFDLLGGQVAKEMMSRRATDRKLRIWSAGCSSGEEPYSISIVMNGAVGGPPAWDVRILATDLSGRMLDIARRGVYNRERFRETSPRVIAENFTCQPGREPKQYQVNAAIRRMVTFARLNLMEPWPMHGPFDAIFCRNVMIYFDKPTQNRLVERFWDILTPGGVLFIGHSESLSGVRHRFEYVQPTVYRKA